MDSVEAQPESTQVLSPKGGRVRKTLLYIAMAVFGIWAVSLADLPSCSRDVAPLVTEPEGTSGRGHIMLSDSMQRLSQVDSFSYLYMTGVRWSVGDMVGSDRSNRRIILSGSDTPAEYELRRIGEDTWWRIRGLDGWHEGLSPIQDADPVNVRMFRDGAAAFAENAEYVRALRPEWVDTPLETTVSSHHLTGRVSVGTVRGMGLGTVGDPPDEAVVSFDVWVEQDTGLPIKMVFQGVPPALPPLGILHLFDLNALVNSIVVPPHPDTVAPPDPLAISGTDGKSGQAPRVFAPVVLPESETRLAPDVTPLESLPASEKKTPGDGEPSTVPAPVVAEQSEMPVEKQEAINSGWTRYVLPTEGYAIEFPDTWEVSGQRDGEETLLVATDEETMNRWETRRLPDTGALLVLAQRRMETLRESETQPQLDVDTSARIPMAVLRYEESGQSVYEYMVVRGPLGRRGIAYSLLLRTTTAVDEDAVRAEQNADVMKSFTLLGMTPD